MTASVSNSRRMHLLPGRLRADVKGLRNDFPFGRSIAARLSAHTGITRVVANPHTGRVLILYDASILTADNLLDLIRELERATRGRSRRRARPTVKQPGFVVRPTAAILLAKGVQPVVAAAFGIGIAVKVVFGGYSERARSERLSALSTIISALNGYPQVRRILARILGPRVPVEVIGDYAGIGIKGYRESLLGLTADFGSSLFAFLELSSLRRASRNARQLLHQEGLTHLRLGDGEVDIPLSELQMGMIIKIEAGERVPADGVVVTGTGLVDESVFTNRAFLSRKEKRDEVFLGSRVRQGSLLVRVTATGATSRLGELLQRAPAHRDTRLPAAVARAVRSWGAAGLSLAAVTFLVTRSWRRAMAVLAVLNPSPMVQSAHAASGAAIETAAKENVRVQRRRALDVLANVDVVLFGKTGTLTAESPMVDDVVPVDGISAEAVVDLAASVLRNSTHPLAVPLLEKALELDLALPGATAVETLPGLGVRARIGGDQILVGGAWFMEDHGVSLASARAAVGHLKTRGSEVLLVAREGRLIGLIGLRERLLPGAAEAVDGLRALGIAELGVLSADPTESAVRLAADLHITRTWSGVDDEGKRAIVRRLQEDGHTVALVGASASDMLAMAQADVAIGFAGGGPGARWTPTPHTAHIVLLQGRLGALPGLVALSRTLKGMHRQNLAVASGVSALAGAAAVVGLLPFGAADEINHFLMLGLLFNARRVGLQRLEQPARPSPMTPTEGPVWHALPPDQVQQILATDGAAGLSAVDASRRLERYGENLLTDAATPGFGTLYVRQLATGMTALLGAAAVASAFVAEPLNAVLIGGILLVNAALGAFQEYRAERATAALRSSVAPTARAWRGGTVLLLPATRLVPGDIVLLQAGDTVPADARVVESYDCEVEEAMLTGESLPVHKDVNPVRPETELADRTSMVYMGSAVTSGRAKAVIVATGMNTAMGQIASFLRTENHVETPLQVRLAGISRTLMLLSVLGGAAFVGAGLLRRLPLTSMVMGGVSLATAAVPEGLPAIVTIALSAAVQRMGRQSLIVRRLSAVETLGRVTVICCDKTGTLTQNRMAVRAIANGSPELSAEPVTPAELRRDEERWILTIGAVCNDATLLDEAERTTLGGSTEGALLLAALDAGLHPAELRQSHERLAELPFSTERSFMAVVTRHPDGKMALMLKGAPETIMEFCDFHRVDGAAVPLTAKSRTEVLGVSDRMAYEAMRVLAMAYLPLRSVPSPEWLEHPRSCVFAGLVGMSDPLRPEVRHAVERAEGAGVRVVMATGDHRSTAIAIARQLGLVFAREGVLDGHGLDAMTEEELAALLPRTQVFARVTPEQKLRIVKAMQARGEVVAMTGDGVNDAPAVKRADVGIAMGHTGTEVTRQASSIVLGDDSFSSIIRAIEEGRGVRRNLRRALGYLLGGNLGETLFVLGATLIGGEVPLLPIHLLLVNLFTDALPVMALAGLPASNGMLEGPKSEDLFDRSFFQGVFRRGLVTGTAATAIYGLARRTGPAARSMTLAGLVASQLVQAQSWQGHERPDGSFTAALGISWTALGAITSVPQLQRLLGTASLGPLAWAQILGVSFAADWVIRAASRLPALPILITSRSHSSPA